MPPSLMDIISIILIAIALAADCFAVSVCKGIATKRIRIDDLIITSLLFGIFQGGMPLLTFLLGVELVDYIAPIDHWIAFVLLSFIGGKMIWESRSSKEEEKTVSTHISHTLLLAIATSIDALATGIVFVPYPSQIITIISVIAGVSTIASCIGYLIGLYGKKHLHINVELVGGLILIFIGCRILIEHLFF